MSTRTASAAAHAPNSTGVTPFRVEVPQADLDDLVHRLERTRWPEAETVDDWSQGLPLSYARQLCAHWARDYDWRATEARLNAVAQFRTEVDGLGIHFLHVRSENPDALPLLMTHGWPNAVTEFLDVIGPLTDPAAHGGDGRDAFHVVCPSLPGHGFSDKPARTGWTVERTARAWAELMARLGYDRYATHGGDWGSWISPLVGHLDPEHVAGVHLTMPLAAAPEEPVDLDERDQAAMAQMASFGKSRSGYAAVQSTRPQTFGYGLTDSPAGLLAWIVERFWEWSDHGDEDLETAVSRDRLLDTVSTYWLTGTAGSAARLFWESWGAPQTQPVDVPTGCTVSPKDAWMPRAWCERRFRDLRHWKDLDRGGHFPALEWPDVLVDELRAFFAPLRRPGSGEGSGETAR